MSELGFIGLKDDMINEAILMKRKEILKSSNPKNPNSDKSFNPINPNSDTHKKGKEN